MVSRIVRTCSIAVLMSLTAFVAACGSKGDLFLPRSVAARSTPTPAAPPSSAAQPASGPPVGSAAPAGPSAVTQPNTISPGSTPPGPLTPLTPPEQPPGKAPAP